MTFALGNNGGYPAWRKYRMGWHCSKCGEIHANQFDACWKCTGIETELFNAPSHPAKQRPRFSIRSILALTYSIAAACGILFTSLHNSALLGLTLYVSAWLLPAPSIGFDYDQTFNGVKNGLWRGFCCCILFTVLISFFLPAVQ